VDGPWGYVLANNDSGVTAIATAKYDGKPIYHAIVVCKPGSGIKAWPQDGKGRRVSFADVGSTSGGSSRPRVPNEGHRPKEYFQYSDARRTLPTRSPSPADRSTARPTSTAIATRYRVGPARQDGDRDRLAVGPAPERRDRRSARLRSGAGAAHPAHGGRDLGGRGESLLPNHYTGFVVATHASYKMIEDAGTLVGRIKKK